MSSGCPRKPEPVNLHVIRQNTNFLFLNGISKASTVSDPKSNDVHAVNERLSGPDFRQDHHLHIH